MLFTTILTTLATATLALAVPAEITPRSTSLKEIVAQFQMEEGCLIDPGNNCAGAPLKDVVINNGRGIQKEVLEMYVAATTASGGKVDHVFDGNVGFAGFVPEQVLTLIEAHGKTAGLKVSRNACMGIPWCGESPC